MKKILDKKEREGLEEHRDKRFVTGYYFDWDHYSVRAFHGWELVDGGYEAYSASVPHDFGFFIFRHESFTLEKEDVVFNRVGSHRKSLEMLVARLPFDTLGMDKDKFIETCKAIAGVSKWLSDAAEVVRNEQND